MNTTLTHKIIGEICCRELEYKGETFKWISCRNDVTVLNFVLNTIIRLETEKGYFPYVEEVVEELNNGSEPFEFKWIGC